jgi:hypothetical protein
VFIGVNYQTGMGVGRIIIPCIQQTTSCNSGYNTAGIVATAAIVGGGGSGYVLGSNISTTGGTGYGCTINITGISGGGGITTFTIVEGGIGYTVGDVLTVAGQASGGGTATFTVSTTSTMVGNDATSHLLAAILINLSAYYDSVNGQVVIYGFADTKEVTGTFIVGWVAP